MAATKKFMVFHQDPGISWKKVEENWAKSAKVESAIWIRTYYNIKERARYCLWLADDRNKLKEVFKHLGVSYQSIMEVEETVPDLWGRKWKEHLTADAESSTLAY